MTSPLRDAERTRSEILDVATEVFAEQGYSGARVDVIAERTRTTKRMIYYYFGGKEQLYLAVLEAAYLGIRAAEQTIDVDESDPVGALRRLAELTFDHHVTHDAFIRLVAIENVHHGQFIRRLDGVRALAAPAMTLLDRILERGRALGEFRADVARFVPEVIIAMLLDYWSDTLSEPDRVRPGVRELTGRPGRTLEQWARDHRADFGVA